MRLVAILLCVLLASPAWASQDGLGPEDCRDCPQAVSALAVAGPTHPAGGRLAQDAARSCRQCHHTPDGAPHADSAWDKVSTDPVGRWLALGFVFALALLGAARWWRQRGGRK
ncbi:MAG: hypothetical protein MUF66_08890 [Gammaproteobacteria bacterium]|jgi:hypothetical protein|nr:hypothetical protein [Gammaproteobacteria bacterium]